MSSPPCLLITISSDSEIGDEEPHASSQNLREEPKSGVSRTSVCTSDSTDGSDENAVDFISNLFPPVDDSKIASLHGMIKSLSKDVASFNETNDETNERCKPNESGKLTHENLEFDPDFGPYYGFTEINVSFVCIFQRINVNMNFETIGQSLVFFG